MNAECGAVVVRWRQRRRRRNDVYVPPDDHTRNLVTTTTQINIEHEIYEYLIFNLLVYSINTDDHARKPGNDHGYIYAYV